MRSMLRIAALVSVVLTAVACGAESTDRRATSKPDAAGFTGDAESRYCDLAGAWAAHELSPPADGSPEYPAYWDGYVKFLTEAEAEAPDVIAEDWAVYEGWHVDRLTPLLRKYDFDPARAEAEATAEETQVFGGPPPEVEAAQRRVTAYESQVCGTSQPAAAEEAVDGNEGSEFCQKMREIERGFQSVEEAGFTAASARKLFTSRTITEVPDEAARVAPADIQPDMEARAEWARAQQVPAVERFGYDIRKLLTEGSADDRHAFNASAPEIRESQTRLLAYEEQVCKI